MVDRNLVGVGVLLATALVLAVLLPKTHPTRVAFVGNSMQFVNDLPRFMQALSKNRLHQDSCLHGALHLTSLLKKGNGMYYQWETEAALIPNQPQQLRDYGACTVAQLLLGYDENLSIENENGLYTNDGKNPCFQSQDYFDYRQNLPTAETTTPWDFVVLNDHSQRPAIEAKRETSLQTLATSYVDLLLQTGATPVLLVTPGYFVSQENNDDDYEALSSVPEFTSYLYQGYLQYSRVLAENLPEAQTPRIAPVGLAFLLLYEEDAELWEKLWFVDGYHPSPHGTYLMGCVLYATLYGKMPKQPRIPQVLWKSARKMQIDDEHVMPFPTRQEAAQLAQVAQRVVLQGDLPQSLVLYNDDDNS